MMEERSHPFYSLISSAEKLAPKKWGLSGSSPYVLIGFLGGVSFLLTQGIDLRPKLGAVLGLATADAIFLGGTCLAQISSFWPPYKRRILVHEAGHLLTGMAKPFLPFCFPMFSELVSLICF
jgi:hypothetical protein